MLIWLEMSWAHEVEESPNPSALSGDLLQNYRRMKLIQKKQEELAKEACFEEPWKSLAEFISGVGKNLRLIETALDLYRQEGESSGNENVMRRYRIIDMMFLQEQERTVLQIADAEHVSKQTVYRDISEARKDIAYYMQQH